MNKIERLTKSSDLLRTFVAVAECQNITLAADSLGRTQSAISVQTKKLEEALEVRLFDRQARGMLLTAEGERLLPVARRIISELSSIGALFDDPLKGRVRVGIPDDYAEAVLEHALVEFSRRHPMVEISARFGCTSEFPTAIRKRKLDVAVVSGNDTALADRIPSERNIWVASTKFDCKSDTPVPLAVLERHACSWRHFGSDALDACGRSWRIAYASESFAGLKSAIRSGLAISVLPRSLTDASMVELTEDDGFPVLQQTERGILINKSAAKEVTQAMVAAIKTAT
ncbi:MAG: LysR family transcriptional regulator [Pseudomonadota bacterium]